MQQIRADAPALRVFLAGLFLFLPAGCPQPDDANVDSGANGTFDNATKISFTPGDAANFSASLATASDVDLFNLGPLAAGDRVVADVTTSDATLDTVAAIFDGRERVHAFNDDRAADSSNLNPRIDFVIRGATGDYYLGVTAFPGSGGSGDYRVSVQITRGAGGSAPTPQIVFLNWVGGQNIVIENVSTFDLEPFDALDVGLPSSTTESLKDRVQEIVAGRYAGFAFTLLNSDDSPAPSGAHSTVFFGGLSRRAFAISEQIDTGNADPSDNAIIFTESFADAFSVRPTFEEVATAIGNTVAHEIGHLLGLVHTEDCRELMDTSCGNDSLLSQQAFGAAPLHESVFPIGLQDSAELIALTLGLAVP